jgi:hypothetical protein
MFFSAAYSLSLICHFLLDQKMAKKSRLSLKSERERERRAKNTDERIKAEKQCGVRGLDGKPTGISLP